jgi:4-hydroxy-tetrahydrodipicolinate synthase
MALDARDAGASGLVVFPHPVFVGEPLTPDVPYEYHRAIAEASELPIVLFQLQPALAGVIFSRETLLKLISIPNVVAIKEASFDAVRFVETVRVLSEAPKRIQVLTGNDNFILESFLLGADGALIGFGTLAIADQLEMLARLGDGDVKGAREVYDEVIRPLVSVIFAPPVRNYRARVKEALVTLDVLAEAHVRLPLLRLDPDERRAVHEAVAHVRLKAPAGAPL